MMSPFKKFSASKAEMQLKLNRLTYNYIDEPQKNRENSGGGRIGYGALSRIRCRH